MSSFTSRPVRIGAPTGCATVALPDSMIRLRALTNAVSPLIMTAPWLLVGAGISPYSLRPNVPIFWAAVHSRLLAPAGAGRPDAAATPPVLDRRGVLLPHPPMRCKPAASGAREHNPRDCRANRLMASPVFRG